MVVVGTDTIDPAVVLLEIDWLTAFSSGKFCSKFAPGSISGGIAN